MQRPRTPGAGITGALTVTLGGEDSDALPIAGTPLQHRSRRAFRLDREVGATLQLARQPLTVSIFTTAFPTGPALGTTECMTWGGFVALLANRREGRKDGPNFVPATFKPESDGRVRRLRDNLLARTAIVLDCETNKETGEVPPPFAVVVARIEGQGWGVVVYTSHNHTADAPRYRIVLLLSAEIATNLPAVEVIADLLGLLGVLDTSKIGASSLFYLPSAEPGHLTHHETVVVDGAPIDAAWMAERAGAILAEREAEQERLVEAAHAEAAARREAKIAAGFDPDDSLIEKLRSHFDLAGVLLAHGYDRAGAKFRHPNSTSGSYGADIKTFGGIERAFSHNANDPLHANNLPDWCGGVTALDVVDAVTILDFGGDRRKALSELAERFNLTKAAERKAIAALIFRLIRQQATQEDIEAQAFAEGARLGLIRAEVIRVATWVDMRATLRDAVQMCGFPNLTAAKEEVSKRAKHRSETAKAAFRLLRRGVPSDELLTVLHRLNEQRRDPLPRDAIGATALWAAQRLKVQAAQRLKAQADA
jgi:hypothetical protein